MELDVKNTIHIAKSLVKESGDRLREEWKLEKSTTNKDVRDIVTKYDRIIETRLTTELLSLFPDHAVKGEELETAQKESEYTWYIDPIDGTKYFAADIPLFTVSLGLTYKQEPILGVIYNPIAHQMYWGAPHIGAWLNYDQISVSQRSNLEELVVYADVSKLKSLAEKDQQWVHDKFTTITKNAYRIRSFGCGSLGLSWLSSGGFDAFIDFTGETKFFDVCAGIAIAKAAGATIEFIDVGIGKPRLVAASNPQAFKAITSLLKS